MAAEVLREVPLINLTQIHARTYRVAPASYGTSCIDFAAKYYARDSLVQMTQNATEALAI